jgi:hypothetical protein
VITARKRLIEQYVAVSEQAEGQKLVRDSERRIEELVEPLVAQR